VWVSYRTNKKKQRRRFTLGCYRREEPTEDYFYIESEETAWPSYDVRCGVSDRVIDMPLYLLAS
jgi:hypothetical protein